MADAKSVMELRNQTGAGVVDCKQALEEAGGDMAKATDILRKKGAAKAARKNAERTVSEGILASYLHHNRRLAAIVEVQCETDFVALNQDFVNFANDMAMQIAAMNPEYVAPENIPAEVMDKQRALFMEELASENKPDEIKAKIVEGKLNKWYSDVCLMKQTFFKDDDKTVEALLTELIAKTGEKIVIARFSRLEMAHA
ncbi:MAG: translation elongation factor Ts [Patescibacteria group bacterium]